MRSDAHFRQVNKNVDGKMVGGGGKKSLVVGEGGGGLGCYHFG